MLWNKKKIKLSWEDSDGVAILYAVFKESLSMGMTFKHWLMKW